MMDHVRCWRLIVEEYSPTIFYVKGVHNIIANILSRVPQQDAPVPEIIETCFLMETENFPLAFAIIAQAQAYDKKLQETLNQFPMEYKQCIHCAQLIIYFKNKIFIPVELWSRLIEWYHEQLLHPGVLRLIESMKQHFHWKTMAKDITNFTKTCKECQIFEQQ